MVRLQGKQQWIAELEAAGVPCGPINDLGEVFENEQVVARGMQVDLPHPSGGTVKLVRNPINMTGTPSEALAHPPTLGEHTESILRDVLGYDDARIAALRRPVGDLSRSQAAATVRSMRGLVPHNVGMSVARNGLPSTARSVRASRTTPASRALRPNRRARCRH